MSTQNISFNEEACTNTEIKSCGLIYYSPTVDYMECMLIAIASGNYPLVAILELIRNAKIEGEGLQEKWSKTYDYQQFIQSIDDMSTMSHELANNLKNSPNYLSTSIADMNNLEGVKPKGEELTMTEWQQNYLQKMEDRLREDAAQREKRLADATKASEGRIDADRKEQNEQINKTFDSIVALNEKLDRKIDSLSTSFDTKVGSLSTNFESKFKELETSVTNGSKEARNWLIGLVLGTVLAVAGMVIGVFIAFSPAK